MISLGKNILTQTGWEIQKENYESMQAINDGSSFMIGNGYLGYRSTCASDRKESYVGCFVTDTWDNADGKWEELSNVPNGLYRVFQKDGTSLTPDVAHTYKRRLDLQTGTLSFEMTFILAQGTVTLKEEKFACMHQPHKLALRQTVISDHDITLQRVEGFDTDQWNLNGEHCPVKSYEEVQGLGIIRTQTGQSNIEIVVGKTLEKIGSQQRVSHGGIEGYQSTLTLKAHEAHIQETIVTVYSSNDVKDPFEAVVNALNHPQDFDTLSRGHRAAWAALWDRFDMRIEGPIRDQVGIRFNLYHALIATPMHKPLPIGARGLSCQAYQGAAFWDQEIYNTPMYLFSHPYIARQLLMYRYETLDGARRKARKHGYEGAFYAWISGKTGDEICPDFFFKDVLSDRPIRNHFNLWQIHISPDIALTIDRYVKLTNDTSFLHDYGLEMILEIARFIASRVVYKPRMERYELTQVQGPDEYHENVDNNAFTNYQSQLALSIALDYLDQTDPQAIHKVRKRINLSDKELSLWRDVAKKLYLPQPNADGLIEQFDGYFKLESIVPAHKVTQRLRDPEEYYGWPNGITVFTQCNKQADVVQLLALQPDRFDTALQEVNYRYYEPRTLHFSSLSPSTHAIVAARLRFEEESYRHFEKALLIDLFNTNEAVSGGTFIGGMHTANNGGTWSMVALGFLGLDLDAEALYRLNPQLPSAWKKITLNLDIQDQRHTLEVTPQSIIVTNQSSNPQPTQVRIKDKIYAFMQSLSVNL
jgi:kojibiose phosphorylase